MNNTPLGKLEKLDVHQYWASEAQDFTPWLAGEANIALLGDEIGIELEVQNVEQAVGSFRADIVCVDTATGHKVLIENQLEKTDHSHLGQILTYAAGLDAVVVVWIADHFREEHRATLDWLNRVTQKSLSFFGLEIELWRIGNSSPAAKFNSVVRPNEWSKPPPLPIELTDTRVLYQEFWTAFKEFAEQGKTPIRVGQPPPESWMSFPIGKSNFALTASVSKQKRHMYAQLVLYGDDTHAHFHLLQTDRSEIESEFGSALEWRELRTKKESQVRITFNDADPSRKSAWPRQHKLLLETLEGLHRAFSQRIKNLVAADWQSDDVEEQFG